VSYYLSVQMKIVSSCIAHGLAKQMTAYCGYGHVAGYLMQKGLIIPQEGFKDPDIQDRPVDPITGEYAKETEDPWAGMSEEDKEREAERLFVLFDRLQRTGVVKMVRPGETPSQ
jgi:hypothetical protein